MKLALEAAEQGRVCHGQGGGDSCGGLALSKEAHRRSVHGLLGLMHMVFDEVKRRARGKKGKGDAVGQEGPWGWPLGCSGPASSRTCSDRDLFLLLWAWRRPRSTWESMSRLFSWFREERARDLSIGEKCFFVCCCVSLLVGKLGGWWQLPVVWWQPLVFGLPSQASNGSPRIVNPTSDAGSFDKTPTNVGVEKKSRKRSHSLDAGLADATKDLMKG
ncbi:hypothetical protein L7F22_015978 [Adiantum nelumboides]|nr:hypothetical protein [Adiantum nelumboides]